MSELDFDTLTARYKYLGVDVRAEWVKATTWLDARPRRRMSRRFFVSWLNRATESQDARLLADRLRRADPYGYREAMK